MACIALLPPPMAMATTEFARLIGYEVSAPWRLEQTIRTANSAHELGRGHRQERRPAAADAVGNFRKRLRGCRPFVTFL